MTDLSPQESRRVKRFLGAIEIGIITTSPAIGIGNIAAIVGLKASLSDIITRNHHITDIQDHKVSIHNVQHNLDVVKSSMVDNIENQNYILDNRPLTPLKQAQSGVDTTR